MSDFDWSDKKNKFLEQTRGVGFEFENHYTEQKSNKGVFKMSKDKLKFDDEELQILQDFERGEFESIKDFQNEKRQLEEAAINTFNKDRRINIRISSWDLTKIQKKAAKEGIPYQTLISSTLHKFIAGKLKDVA